MNELGRTVLACLGISVRIGLCVCETWPVTDPTKSVLCAPSGMNELGQCVEGLSEIWSIPLEAAEPMDGGRSGKESDTYGSSLSRHICPYRIVCV